MRVILSRTWSDKEETERKKKNSGQEGEQNDIEEDNDIRNEAAAFWS